jgi:hypothetical protein
MRGQPSGSSDGGLRRLFDAIAAQDAAAVSSLLTAAPALALEAARTGATRASPAEHFFPSIDHYAYAGDTPLHLAAAAHAPGIVRDLLARGASARVRNRRGAGPLHYAADGHPGSRRWRPEAQAEVVRILVGAGADPEAEDDRGVTPLHRAVRTRSAAAVEALLLGGASPHRKNRAGSTPLHLAVQTTGKSGSGSPQARADQAEIVRILLACGARPTDRNGTGRSVRECATAPWLRGLIDPR